MPLGEHLRDGAGDGAQLLHRVLRLRPVRVDRPRQHLREQLFDIWYGTSYEEVRHGLRGGQVVPACEGSGEGWSY